ncbi:hypothetical protein, partial [Nocardia brasiliensis]|uniref:hypothetical protein n=1 Tax=Nocardia brasiliensis TaxID=37326 RepID=UPI002456E05B
MGARGEGAIEPRRPRRGAECEGETGRRDAADDGVGRAWPGDGASAVRRVDLGGGRPGAAGDPAVGD